MSLRDIIVASQSANAAKLQAMGSRSAVRCSTLADASEMRDWRMVDLRGAIPAFIHISDGKLHDVNVLDMLALEAGAF